MLLLDFWESGPQCIKPVEWHLLQSFVRSECADVLVSDFAEREASFSRASRLMVLILWHESCTGKIVLGIRDNVWLLVTKY